MKKNKRPAARHTQEDKRQNLRHQLLQIMESQRYSPMRRRDLWKALNVEAKEQRTGRLILQQLVEEGIIVFHEDRYSLKKTKPKQLPAEQEVVCGLLKVHRRGFGFLRPDDPTTFSQDIFIPRHATRNAVDGDRVEVAVNLKVVSEKGPEGRVVSILERGRTHTAGTICRSDHKGQLWAYVPLLGDSQEVCIHHDDADMPLGVGDRVILHMLNWGQRGQAPNGEVCHHIGNISDPSCDIEAAIEEYDIRGDFPSELIEEAKAFGMRVKPKDLQGRRDFRGDEVVTIDPTTAKDFDDAIGLTKDKKGHYHLHVHIADVSHYVRPDSAIDREAYLRCNSTYFPGTCIPMLPPELSENLCSLRPHVNRLVVSVLMKINQKGELLSYEICRGVIRSAKRFTYQEAKEVLDGKRASKHQDLLNRMVELCIVLKRKRYERGSLELALPEIRVICGANGIPQGLQRIEYDVTHQMIEEFMLKANETVATHLNKRGEDLPYRTHEEPSEDNLKNFVQLARAFGHRIDDKPSPQDLQALFDTIGKEAYSPYLATSYIRSMKQAYYSTNNLGHYGLSLEYYCHFTSPIRRYPDLIVHRTLFDTPPDSEQLKDSANRCSDQERISAKAEMAVTLLKKLRLLDAENEKTPYRSYDVIITQVRGFGVFFEVPTYMLEALLHISELGDDYYIYDEKRGYLTGRHTGRRLRPGDKLTVMLQEVNFITLETRWHLVPDASFPSHKRRKGKPRRKRLRR